uniref:Uncharacterized protein n=1 Tax=Timema douglasi TaxID=61478 RepID=A0A7R8ZEK3_TIMDO|nr:unnamed protein product [Timema douglasi]
MCSGGAGIQDQVHGVCERVL